MIVNPLFFILLFRNSINQNRLYLIMFLYIIIYFLLFVMFYYPTFFIFRRPLMLYIYHNHSYIFNINLVYGH